MMVTRPQTLGYSLTDSPVGLAAWFYDKFADWTYTGGHPEMELTRDEMLDDITLYGSSILPPLARVCIRKTTPTTSMLSTSRSLPR